MVPTVRVASPQSIVAVTVAFGFDSVKASSAAVAGTPAGAATTGRAAAGSASTTSSPATKSVADDVGVTSLPSKSKIGAVPSVITTRVTTGLGNSAPANVAPAGTA